MRTRWKERKLNGLHVEKPMRIDSIEKLMITRSENERRTIS